MVDVVDDNGASPNLERNVGYVTSVVGENEGKLTRFDVTLKIRIRHSEQKSSDQNPLELWEAKRAVDEAERRGLVAIATPQSYAVRLMRGNEKVYYTKSK